MSNMVQCKFEKTLNNCKCYKIAWIKHSSKLKVGCNVELISDDKVESWKVIEMFSILPEDVVMENSRDYKRTRLASDI